MDSEMLQQMFENHETHSPAEAMRKRRQATVLERSLLLLFITAAAISFVWFFGNNLQALSASSVAHINAAAGQAGIK